jgi:CelD/BcsL family acetyltransferase involved in cellulose biosynthesis
MKRAECFSIFLEEHSAARSVSLQPMSNSHYTVELVTSEEELPGLQEQWNRLSAVADRPNVFMTYDWFRAWYDRVVCVPAGEQRQPYILVLKKDGLVTGITPLVRTVSSRFGFQLRRLQFVAREWDYNDLVLGKDMEAQTEAVLQFLARTPEQWDMIDIRDLRETGNLLASLQGAISRAGLCCNLLPEEERCPYMPIDGPWSETLARRSSSTRHTFRVQQSRLNRMSAEGLRLRIVENPEAEPGMLQKMIAVEAQKHVGGRPSPPFLGVNADVFTSLFNTLGPRGWLCLAVMELGDRLLAWHLMFRCGGKIWGYLTAYDHEFSRLSPGSMLIPQIIDYGYSHGFTEYDFLNGEESYKLRWTTGYHHTYRFLIWSQRPISQLRTFVHFASHSGGASFLARTAFPSLKKRTHTAERTSNV